MAVKRLAADRSGASSSWRQRLGPHDRQRDLRRPYRAPAGQGRRRQGPADLRDHRDQRDRRPAARQPHIQACAAWARWSAWTTSGPGSSSFAYLQELSLDIVKIDGRYVRELAGNGRDGAMVRRLVELCRDLKIRTVAEMVETVEVEDIVRKAGVDFAQGWLFGKPADQPQPALKVPSVTPVARRAGVSEGWG
jgi:hypothetical protein